MSSLQIRNTSATVSLGALDTACSTHRAMVHLNLNVGFSQTLWLEGSF
jgi:hypothetical protein